MEGDMNVGNFKYDTYIVLDLPKEIGNYINKIRSDFNDVFYTALPSEITVAGSSGVGVLELKQEVNNVFKILNSIASETKPIKASFGGVNRFPYTNTFFFTLQDEKPFRNLHKTIAESAIKFTDSKFPYKPHTTLCSHSTISEEEIQQLSSLEIPEEFILETMSVYSLENNYTGDVKVHLLHRICLTGKN